MLCVGAVACVVLVLGAAGAFGRAVRVERVAAGKLIGALGAAGTVVVGWHVVSKPGAGALGADMVKLASGVWIALVGCVATTIGGLMAATPEKPAPFVPAAPPSFGGLGPAVEPTQQPLSVGPPA
jgi:hypothetical protein